jgi:hypothetical protein
MEGEPDCLRRKAYFCFLLAMRVPGRSVGAALNRLGSHLITDAEAMEREHFVVPRRNPDKL